MYDKVQCAFYRQKEESLNPYCIMAIEIGCDVWWILFSSIYVISLWIKIFIKLQMLDRIQRWKHNTFEVKGIVLTTNATTEQFVKHA